MHGQSLVVETVCRVIANSEVAEKARRAHFAIHANVEPIADRHFDRRLHRKVSTRDLCSIAKALLQGMVAFSTAWSTTHIVSRCVVTRCARIGER